MTGDRGIPKLRIAAERTGTSIISLSIGEPPIAMRESDYPILLGIGSSPIPKNPSITSVILPPYWTLLRFGTDRVATLPPSRLLREANLPLLHGPLDTAIHPLPLLP